jgi:CheY-like chemotaxis protein
MNSALLLLVEDEPMILYDVEDALTAGGYEVVTAVNGDEAMARLSEQAGNFAGLITDVRLGDGMNGWEVARRAREANGGIPVIYITADSGSDWASQGLPGSLLVQKPFANAQLVTAISTLLTEAQCVPHASGGRWVSRPQEPSAIARRSG